jgi:glycosyltransferase involved in cell wall biosynthesis
LLDACATLPADISWSLTIAGDGERSYQSSLQARVQKLSLQNKTTFVGHIDGDQKREFFSNSDMLIAPSHTENFGLVVAEALAHGVPVIASRGTPWSGVQEKGCGLWVENESSSLAAAIVRMASMPLVEMGDRGREWMRTEFAWDRIAADMVQQYQTLLSEARRNLIRADS